MNLDPSIFYYLMLTLWIYFSYVFDNETKGIQRLELYYNYFHDHQYLSFDLRLRIPIFVKV